MTRLLRPVPPPSGWLPRGQLVGLQPMMLCWGFCISFLAGARAGGTGVCVCVRLSPHLLGHRTTGRDLHTGPQSLFPDTPLPQIIKSFLPQPCMGALVALGPSVLFAEGRVFGQLCLPVPRCLLWPGRDSPGVSCRDP